jgi:pyrroloquinoline quinone biosynthesis protein B
VIVRVLGSAAGGGVPQWNCACPNCSAARAGDQPTRTQSSIAVSADGERWLLLNCSPDIAVQIERFAPLQPRGLRGTPIDGVLLTDANVDHLGGLAVLRQSGAHRFLVRSSEVVRAIAAKQPAFAPFARPPHRWLDVPLGGSCSAIDADDLAGTRLTVRAIPVPGMTPGYDGRRSLRGAVVAYEIAEAGQDARLLFAPVFAQIDDLLRAAIDGAQIAFLDGTFYTDDELVSQRLLEKHAESLGHMPVSVTLGQLQGTRSRIIFTHINNSNPMLEPSSREFERISEAGAELAFDGMELHL